MNADQSLFVLDERRSDSMNLLLSIDSIQDERILGNTCDQICVSNP